MRFKLNQKGQVVLFFVFLVPLFLLLLVISVELSKRVHAKIKLQGVLDKGIYAGAGSLTDSLNRIALLNQKVFDLHRERKEDFLRRGSKRNEKEAKRQILETMRRQNLLLEEMEKIAGESYPKAYQIVNEVIREEYPGSRFIPLYQAPLILEEGLFEELAFSKIRGNVFDPTGYKKVPKDGFALRIAFKKNPATTLAVAGLLEVSSPKAILPILDNRESLKTAAAALPYGGSVWHYANSPKEGEHHLYRTGMVPLRSLPREGFLKGFQSDEIHH